MAEKTPTLELFGVVGEDFFGDGFSEKTVAEFLRENADAPEVSISLNSGGGFVDTGLAIYNLLRGFPGKVSLNIVGVAASAASLIAMAGDERIMGEGSLLMVHPPWNVTLGSAAAHRKAADTLDKQGEQLCRIYSSRSGQDRDVVWAWMEEETWMDADEAVERGFATQKSEAKAESKALASVRLDHLKLQHMPQRLSQARERHPDLIPPPRPAPQQRAAASTSLPAGGREGLTAPTAVAEVKDIPMTTPEASATPPAEPVDLKNDPNIIALNQELADAKAQLGDMQRAKAEAERVAEINRMCALPRAQAVLKPGAVAKFIEEKKPVEAVRDELFEAMAADQDRTQGEFNTQVRVSGGEDSAEKWLKGAQALVIQKCSPQALATVRQDMSLRNENTSDLNLGEFRGMSMLDLAKDCLARAGVRTRGMDKREIVGRAFTMRARGEGYITQGTGDFPTLLENTMHKVLQARYRTTADTWSRFCATGSVSDFRTHNRYRTGSLGTLDLVLENGEYKYKAIPEGEKSTIAATTKGNLYNLSRQAIINDDMGVLNGIAMAAGRAARLSIEVDVYTLLALNSGLGPTMSDGLTLFHATHANVGTGGVPSVTTFDELNNLLGKMLDVTGNEVLDLRPSVWVGPKSLGMSVRVINEAQYDTTVSNKFQVPNGVRGIFSDIVDTARITGTRWYAFANPAEVPTIEVAFLDGNQEPFVDNETGWSVDGVTWKVRHDYGVAAVDYRGAVTNAGA